MVVHLEISFTPQHRSAYSHTIFHFCYYTVEKTVNKANNACFFVEVGIIIYAFEALHQRYNNELHILELCRLLDLADGLLNDLHVFVIPFGLLGPLYDSAFLLHKFFDLFKD